MLAFYGWTDRLLFNIMNLKNNVYPDEPADLFILLLERVSLELVERIRETKIFQNIFFLRLPQFHKDGPRSMKEKIVHLMSGWRYDRCYREQLRQQGVNASYRIFFTGAFWSESLFVFRYLLHINRAIRIIMVEEGTTNYCASDGWQFRCMPTSRLRELLFRLFYFPLTWGLARRAVDGLYLYPDEILIRQCDLNLEAWEMPVIDTENPLCFTILQELGEKPALELYRAHRVIYIGGPIVSGYEETFEETSALVQIAAEVFGKEEILFRGHPLHEQEESFIDVIKTNSTFDRGALFLDAVLANTDLGSKLLITRNSSVPFSVWAQTGICPYIVFTYRLYSTYLKTGEECLNNALLRMLEIYPRGRLLIPSTDKEFRAALRRWRVSGRLSDN